MRLPARLPSASLLLAALRRLAAWVAVAAAGACALGLAIAALTHRDLRRGLAIGLYIGGAALTATAFLLGSRPPVRGKRDTGGFAGLGRWMGGGVRWATREEHREAINFPAVLLTVGVVLILLGVAVDDRR